MRLGRPLVVTHGNGPVVGKILMRQMLSRERVAPMTLDVCVAHSQGGIAYLLTQGLENALRAAGDPRAVACLLTQVEVDPEDPAFADPAKPVGYFYDAEEARALESEIGWLMREDAGRGWRHVVPSPRPRDICGVAAIRALSETGAVVIAAGGGGIPIRLDAAGLGAGVEAVIDKDLSSALLARLLGIDTLLILTGVRHAAVDFGGPNERALGAIGVAEARRHLADGQFPPGSMGPKIEAGIDFVARGGRRAAIGHLEEALAALTGAAGTHILADV